MRSLLGSLILAAVALPLTLAAQTTPTPAPATATPAPAASAAPAVAKKTPAKRKVVARHHRKGLKTPKSAAEKKAA